MKERVGLVLASGLLLGASFAPFHWLPAGLEVGLPAVLILIAPVPFLVAVARGAGGWAGAGLGLVWTAASALWLVGVYPGLGAVAFVMVLGLAALLTAPLGWLLAAVRRRHGVDGLLRWSPIVWCAWEGLRAIPPVGSTWCSLAHAFWGLPVLIGVVDLAGFALVTAIIATVSAGLAALWLRRPIAVRLLAVGAVALSLALVYGAARIAFLPADGERVDVAMVQLQTPGELKRPGYAQELFDEHVRWSRRAPRGTELVLWPETAVPGRYYAWPSGRRTMRSLARDLRATLITGGVEPLPPSDEHSPDYRSAAFVTGHDGRLVDVGHKVHLVIFAEYTPGRRWLPRSVTGLTEQFTAGERLRAVDTPLGRIAVPICYESVFPTDVRVMVADGAELIAILTNDDQLGEWGARQHFQQAVFRAVEHRRWVARCTNSGISAIIDPAGRVHERSGWAEKRLLSGAVWRRLDWTPYTRGGETFRWATWLLTVWLLWRRRGTAAGA